MSFKVEYPKYSCSVFRELPLFREIWDQTKQNVAEILSAGELVNLLAGK